MRGTRKKEDRDGWKEAEWIVGWPEELDMMREEGGGEPCRDVAPLHWSHSFQGGLTAGQIPLLVQNTT